ncbi:YlxR family protein [Microcoleus sp. ARI1-B5]|uniref:YlxR family protein n=1 Tax=unclassified Microcoleus TaxID=2642155 RepID=UPI002FCFF81E
MKPNYRCCASCRKIGHKEAFWRVVRLYPSHQVQLDRGLGRSAYLCPEVECLKAAQKKNRLGRSLKAPVPDELYQTLGQRLATSDCTSDSASTGRQTDKSSAST